MRTNHFVVPLVAALVLVAPAARGDERAGLTLGARAMYGVPFGTAADGHHLEHLAKGTSPLQLDCGYRFDPHWQAGGYFGYGFVRLGSQARSALAAQGATDIDGHALMRAGVQAIYTILPDATFAPWAGVTVGYEWLRYASANIGGTDTEVGLRGFEAGVQVGADYRVASRFTVGPFASFNVGQFQSHITTQGSHETSTSVADKGIHEWLQVGVKGTFNL